MFQVVPPCGGHPTPDDDQNYERYVSSRAPVWGASHARRDENRRRQGFKSCPRVGGIRLQ